MKNIKIVFLMTILFHFFLLYIVQFTVWPEVFSFPYLLNNKFILYKDFVHPYPPLLTLFLANMYKIFGYQLITLKIVTWSLILINDFLLVLILNKFIKDQRVIYITFFGFVLFQTFLEGNQLWFDIAVVTPLLIGFYFAINKVQNKKNLLIAGICFLLAGLIKQTGGLFFLGFLIWLLINKKIREFILISTIAATVFIVFLTSLYYSNSLLQFLNWVVYYPSNFWTKFPGYVQMNLSKQDLLILLVLLIPTFINFFQSNKRHLLYFFIVIGLFSVYPRFSWFHSQTVLPFIFISIAIFFEKYKKVNYINSAVFVSLIFVLILQFNKVNFSQNARFYSEADISLANSIKKEIGTEKYIYFLGLPSNIYQLTDTIPPKPWLDNYGWYFEMPSVENEVLEKWSLNMPKFIFWKEFENGNWYDIGTYNPKKITLWIQNNYNLKGEMEGNINIWERKD